MAGRKVWVTLLPSCLCCCCCWSPRCLHPLGHPGRPGPSGLPGSPPGQRCLRQSFPAFWLPDWQVLKIGQQISFKKICYPLSISGNFTLGFSLLCSGFLRRVALGGFSLPSFHTKGKHSANLDFDTETISTLCQPSGNSKTGGVKFQYFFLPIFGHCERFQIKLQLESTAFWVAGAALVRAALQSRAHGL